ncbi:MAG: SDR family oxidoreductase [Spirochaetota bacterium]
MTNEHIEGRLFVITGAAGGIGKELVRLLLKAKAHVLATDLNDIALKSLEDSFDRHNDRLLTQQLDVTSESSWKETLETTTSYGKAKLYGLINSAGYLKPGYLTEVSAKDIDLHFDVNAKGVITGSSIIGRYFKGQGQGHIINIASLAGVTAIPGIALYSASKFAVRGFSLAFAEELRGSGVCVSVVCPDAVKTGMLDLQVDYEEAALTFSGGDPLSADEVAREIVQLIGKDRVEILLPEWRGALAKFNSLIPDLSQHLISHFQKMGLESQKKFKENR